LEDPGRVPGTTSTGAAASVALLWCDASVDSDSFPNAQEMCRWEFASGAGTVSKLAIGKLRKIILFSFPFPPFFFFFLRINSDFSLAVPTSGAKMNDFVLSLLEG
jgi:hypothetical protein